MKTYPSWRYHRTLPARIVSDPDAEDALGDGWAMTPAEFDAPAETAPAAETHDDDAEDDDADDDSEDDAEDDVPAKHGETKPKPKKRKRRR